MKAGRRRTVAAIVSGLGLALCAQAHAQAQWQQVVDAAKKEGEVVLYSAAVGSSTHKAIAKAFEKKYGIRVDILEARASELRERIRTEQAAGRYLGDVHQNGTTTTILMRDSGNLQPVGPLPHLRDLVPPFKADEYRVPVYVLTYGILVNTKLVKPDEEPKSWQDLLDSRWKGKILSDDMRALGGGSVFFMVMHDRFGREFHEKLAAQQPMFTRDIRNAERRIVQGEFPIYSPELYTFYTLLKGLPVKFIVPKEGMPYIGYELSLLKNAPHPNAARLLIDFMLEPESQLVFANAGNKPVIGGVIERANPAFREVLGSEPMGTTTPERQNAMLELANQIYGK